MRGMRSCNASISRLGFVGTIIGHLVIGIAFSFNSAMGLVGLGGVVV